MRSYMSEKIWEILFEVAAKLNVKDPKVVRIIYDAGGEPRR
jgi:hypothetical protein